MASEEEAEEGAKEIVEGAAGEGERLVGVEEEEVEAANGPEWEVEKARVDRRALRKAVAVEDEHRSTAGTGAPSC